jgi:hypothetical protein
VRVIPIECIIAASAPVKYSVVNQAKDFGDLRAIAVKRTVHTGNRVVAALAVFVYALKIFDPILSSLALVAAAIRSSEEVFLKDTSLETRGLDEKEATLGATLRFT